MELLTHHADYLQNAPVLALHAESMAWLKELDFWSEEMIFFYKLLHNKETVKAFSPKDVAAIGKKLVWLNGEMLDVLRNKVANHEQVLALVCKEFTTSDVQAYYDAHRKLSEEVQHLQLEIRRFKRDVFSFILI